MIFKRTIADLRAQNWRAIFIEIVIVVLGVFLGMQVNNWNEARIESVAAADYRQQIIDDLQANVTDMAGRKAYYLAVRTHALAALAAIENPTLPRGESFLVDAYQASQVWLRPLSRTGYDEMVGAGLSNSIGNREERAQLTVYYTQVRQFDATALATTSYRERLRRAMPYAVQLEVRQKCGDRVTTIAGGAQMAALPGDCSLGLDPATVGLGVSRIADAELREDLTRHISDIDQKLSAFERYIRLAKDNQLMLAAQTRDK